MSRLVAGQLVGVFGIKGELKCAPSSLAENALVPGRELWNNAGERLRCRSARKHQGRLIVAFDGVESIEQARKLVGSELLFDAGDVELGADEYLDADLIGLRLLDERGHERGRVVGVEHLPAQDCLVIEPGGALVPLVRAYAPVINLSAGTIVLTLPEGLLDA